MFKELKIKIVISDRWGNLSREAKTAKKKNISNRNSRHEKHNIWNKKFAECT